MSLPVLIGPYGSPALKYIDRFAEYGANAFWFHGFDENAFEACEKFGIAACVEFQAFRANFDDRPELIPIGEDCEPIRYGNLVQGVCLSQQEFLLETLENLRAGLEQFQPQGIWLDYLTYAGWFETPQPDLQQSCFCDACILDFCEASGLDADHPQEILAHYRTAWTDHKCERIARFALLYAQLIKIFTPDCIVGAYMCPWTPAEYDGALTRIFAQDYERMSAAIDIFTPLIYAQKSGRSNRWGREFLEKSVDFIPTNRKTQLILDALDFPESLTETANSPIPSWGIQLFGGAAVFEDSQRAEIFRSAVDKIRARIGY